jgi:uncharacterized protein involved in outer membrane biogenesis
MSAWKSGRRIFNSGANSWLLPLAQAAIRRTMKFLVRWTFRFFIILLVLAVALVLLKDALLKSVAENSLRAQTGMDARIGKLELGLLSPKLTIEQLKLFNPAEYGGSPFVEIDELHLEYDLAALAWRNLRFRLVRLSLTEINIVEAMSGQTNLLAILGEVDAADSSQRPYSFSGIDFGFGGIEVLNLTLGKVRHISLKNPGKRAEYNLDLRNEIITNIKSVADLSNIIMNILLRNGITITEVSR